MKKILCIVISLFLLAFCSVSCFADEEIMFDSSEFEVEVDENAFDSLTEDNFDYSETYTDYGNDAVLYDTEISDTSVSDESASAPHKNILLREIIVIGIALLIGFLVASSMKSKMKNTGEKHDASDYVVNKSFSITGSQDVFVRDEVQKTAKPKPQDQK